MKDIFGLLNKPISRYKARLKTFQDIRIAGLQAIVDFVFSHEGDLPRFNSVDITEFFTLEEDFLIGYGELKAALKEAIDSRKTTQKTHDLVDIYSDALSGRDAEIQRVLEELRKKGICRPYKLNSGTYMTPEADDKLFTGKKVIVTGAETGIGRAVALEFARRGAEVALHYPYEKFSRGAYSAEDLIKESGKEARAFQGDFRTEKGIESFASEAMNYLGGVDILVNNAGITLCKPFEKAAYADFDSLVSVNLKGNYFLTQRALPYLKKSRGVVVNIASDHAVSGMAGHSIYAATKGAVVTLTRELAMELSPDIRVFSITPGWVAGVNHFRLMPKLDLSREGQENTPIGIDTPENFARNLVMLASVDSITGVNVLADRGMSSGMASGREYTKIPEEPWGKRYLE